MNRLCYDVDDHCLGPRFAARFVTLDADTETLAFVADERIRRHGIIRWTARAMARSMVGAFSADAMFGTYPLFMLSTSQWAQLLRPYAGGRLLDVGAAAGHITTKLAPLFDDVTATDVSRPMVRRLRALGLRASMMDLATTPAPDGPYDTVALLNVLDRCASPLTLLDAAVDSLTPQGTLVVSMPFPYDPCWYDGPVAKNPIERLPVGGRTWEDGAATLAEVLERSGLTVQAITRAPYLSGGDRHNPLYVLDAAIIVATR